MRYRPIDKDPEDPRLGRFIPDDWAHVEKYPLTAPAEEAPTPRPVVIGVDWYAEFDRPQEQVTRGGTKYVLPGADSLTNVRGGHCVCLEPDGEPDPEEWWEFYDQGAEGACVGFGWSRCMSLLNQELYTARWLWDRAKEIDEWPETNPGDDNGTSCRAAGDILKDRGHVDWSEEYADDDNTERDDYTPAADNGIKLIRWARSVDDVHKVLGYDGGGVTFLNSWGRDGYPHRVWMPDDVLEHLMNEQGEVAVPTDR
jgi:hypothetical protein